MKKYIIRQIDFGYDDEQYFTLNEGSFNIAAQYDSLEDAEAAYWELEKKALQGRSIWDYPGISPCGKQDRVVLEQLHAYFKEEFGKLFLVKEDWSELLQPSAACSIPYMLSVKQAKKIQELSNIKHYQIISLKKEDPHFYGIYITGHHGTTAGWLKFAVYFSGEQGYGEGQVPLVFQSKEAVLRNPPRLYTTINFLKQHPIKGSMEALSDAPAVLASFINAHQQMEYHADRQEIVFNYVSNHDFMKLNQLLKQPILEVKPLPEEEVEKCRYNSIVM